MKYRELARRAREIKDTFDFVLVMFPGHSVVWLARFHFRIRR